MRNENTWLEIFAWFRHIWDWGIIADKGHHNFQGGNREDELTLRMHVQRFVSSHAPCNHNSAATMSSGDCQAIGIGNNCFLITLAIIECLHCGLMLGNYDYAMTSADIDPVRGPQTTDTRTAELCAEIEAHTFDSPPRNSRSISQAS